MFSLAIFSTDVYPCLPVCPALARTNSLVHVEMVAHSGALVAGAEDALRAALGKDVASFERAFENLLHAYRRINVSMDTMWGR